MAEKIAVITGASRGLGRSAAVHLVAAGVRVIGTYRSNKEQADALIAELGVDHVAMLPLDVEDAGSFAAFAASVRQTAHDAFGRDDVDFLVNNAGTSLHESFATTTEAQFDEMVAVHLKAPFFLTQAMLPVLADGGRILNVSSGLTRITIPGSAAYAAVKGAVEVLTRYQAQELGSRGIRVNTVAPGAIATDFSGGMVRDNPDVNAMVVGSTALARIGVADDIGGAIALLLADGFGWASGAKIELTGGQRL
jgi:NAD(P)-dependent dehydrogenase (short-subunit alcohol dehydrogenase family)